MQRRIPFLTLSIALLCGLVTYVPDLGSLCVLDRQAVYHGQWWRLYTGHLVHFSTLHLLPDLFTLVVTGWLLEIRRLQGYVVLLLVLPPAISAAVLALEPALVGYGGISGLTCGTLAYAALDGMCAGGLQRRIHGSILLLLGLKIAGGLLGLPFVSVLHPDGHLITVPLAHAAGALTAVLLFAITGRMRRQTGRGNLAVTA